MGGAGPAAFAGEVVPDGGAASREDGGVLCDLGTQPSGLCMAYLEVDRFFGGGVAGGGVAGGGAEAVGGGGGALGVVVASAAAVGAGGVAAGGGG